MNVIPEKSMLQKEIACIKKFLPNGLLARSLLIIITPLLIVQGVLTYIFIERHTETVLKLLAQDIAGDSATVVYIVEKGRIPLHRIQKLALMNFRFRVNLEPGTQSLEKVGIDEDSWLYNFLDTAFSEKLTQPYFIKMDDDTIKVWIQSRKGIVFIESSRKRFFSRTTPLVMLFTGASTLFMILIAALFMRNQVRPIRKLAIVVDRFGKGDEHATLVPQGAREIKQAGEAFLKMRERIKRQLTERFEMLSYVSHDLRTPITRIKLQLACMKDSSDVRDLKKDVNQMQRMLEGFLVYARTYAEEPSLPIEFSLFLEEIVASFRRSGFSVDYTCPAHLLVNIKTNQFQRCLSNFLTNAEKVATKASISVQEDSAYVHIFIDDNGPGIPQDEREHVFKPFYRLDTARNLDHFSNVGLGMSIALDIVRAHGGDIFLESVPANQQAINAETEEQKGLRVHIVLPI